METRTEREREREREGERETRSTKTGLGPARQAARFCCCCKWKIRLDGPRDLYRDAKAQIIKYTFPNTELPSPPRACVCVCGLGGEKKVRRVVKRSSPAPCLCAGSPQLVIIVFTPSPRGELGFHEAISWVGAGKLLQHTRGEFMGWGRQILSTHTRRILGWGWQIL